MGLAYLPDGSQMDYKEYIATHPHWQKVRRARFDFDKGLCVVCHRDVTGNFETHHLYYTHLGNEHLTDVVTLCSTCHTKFHNSWQKQTYWQGNEQNHWQAFDLEHTARLCSQYCSIDKFISGNAGDINLCNKNSCREIVEEYLRLNGAGLAILIDPNDVLIFVRNKRYELLFKAYDEGLSVEEFLDRQYGAKVRGKNPIRVEAGAFFTKRSIKKMRYIYRQNKNIKLLMDEVSRMEELNEKAK